MFDVNDRNLTIFAITALVIVYVLFGGEAKDKGDIIEKAIIALGSLATGSVLGDSRKAAALTKKLLKKE